MSQSDKELFELKKASLVLLENRGFDTSFDNWLLQEKYNNLATFRLWYNETLPSLKKEDYKILQFFESEGLNPKFDLKRCMSAYYPPKGDNSYNPKGCVVYFSQGDRKVSKDEITYFCRMIEFFGVTNGIIISKGALTSSAESLCKDYVPCRLKSGESIKYGCFIQHYLEEELFFNPLDHIMVPKHRLLSQEEVQQLSNLKIGRSFPFPKISALDAIAKRLGARPDDIIEITRNSMIKNTLIEEEIAYRLVYMPQSEKKK